MVNDSFKDGKELKIVLIKTECPSTKLFFQLAMCKHVEGKLTPT